MNNVIIVIPIYKKDLSQSEVASLNQCLKILGQYPITFICPENLDLTNYKNIIKNIHCNIQFINFEDKHFNSLQSYSKLMLKAEFYNKFIDYKFMLVYQLDAWVFENALDYWCKQDYDYIGAPWFVGYESADKDSPLMDLAGNGGFSLRKISTMLELVKTKYIKRQSLKTFLKNRKKNLFPFNLVNLSILMLKYLHHILRPKVLWESNEYFEDYVIVKYGKKIIKTFKLAPPQTALKFSFEVQPKRLYKMNNEQLPFGCHAFEKYDFDFWQEFIKRSDDCV